MDADIVRMLAVLAGIDVPTEDEQGLVKAFGNVLASSALLQPLDLSGIEPVVTFDPRWDYLGRRGKAPRAGEADARMMVPDLQWCGIGELSLRFRRGEASSARVTESLLGRIIETEGRLHAYVNVMADSAMRAAEAADAAFKQGRVRSFLQGVPIAVKDLCETEGVPTGAGSHVLDGFVPTRDAEVVRHLRDAGAVLIGKTVTHEFAYGQNMPDTRNAWDQSCYPGGSSAGSGVAVAAGTAYGAVGTDTGGSIRVPASVNGVVGLKPTFDRVSRVGVFPMSPTLDTVGPITRSVEDAALMLDVMAGGGTADPNTGDAVRGYLAKPWLDLRGVRIGVERGYFFPYDLEEDVRSAVETAIELFRELGASVVDVEIEHLDLTVPAGTAVLAGDTSEWHQRLLRDRRDSYVRETRIMLELGEFLFATAYIKAQKARSILKEAVRQTFEAQGLDALAVPTLPGTTLRISELEVDLTGSGKLNGFLRHCFLANVIGIPALSIPVGFNGANLPIGLQLLGRPFDEEALLQIGHVFQGSTGWHRCHPPGF